MGNNKFIMRFFTKCPAWIFPLFFAGPMFLCGCATTAPQNLFAISGPGWHVEQGQALWTPKRGAPQFGGDLILATDTNGRSFVQFSKTPLTIATAEVTPERWLLRFPQGGGTWSGHGPPPTRTVWPYLADALAGKALPEPLNFEQKTGGNWQLENPKTGEILEGFLSP